VRADKKKEDGMDISNELYQKIAETFLETLQRFSSDELERMQNNPDEVTQAYLDALGEAQEHV